MRESETRTSQSFPWRKAPEIEGKFPFRDVRYYNSRPEESEMKSALKVPKLGYLAQRSVQYLEATGRKPELENVPWFTIPESNGNGKR